MVRLQYKGVSRATHGNEQDPQLKSWQKYVPPNNEYELFIFLWE